MIKKQFKINTSEIGNVYIDNPNGEHMSWIEVEEILNSLFNENKQLKQENQRLIHQVNICVGFRERTIKILQGVKDFNIPDNKYTIVLMDSIANELGVDLE